MITIANLYPDLLNLYSDRGNAVCLQKRLQWRGIDVQIRNILATAEIDFAAFDLVLLGGGSDREVKRVCDFLQEVKTDFSSWVENGGPALCICGGYQMLGNSFFAGGEKVAGLGILDIVTDQTDAPFVGNIALDTPFGKVVGFENHSGRTNIGDHTPFGRVLSGFGNNGADKTEGVLHHNLIGTHLHGALLGKNPEVADFLLQAALERQAKAPVTLQPLDDSIELAAKQAALNLML